MRVAVLPARGGSKRIPRKNVRNFRGRPMIAWPIAAARESACFDHIVVSTDDEEIVAVAEQHGAEVPFRRPPKLADDHTGTLPVMAHAAEAVSTLYGPVDVVCCIYPTTPLITPADLDKAVQTLLTEDCAYVFAVTRYPSPIQRALRRDPRGRVRMFDPEMFSKRSQDLEEAWHDAGQFYAARPETWRRQQPIFTEASIGLPLPRQRAVDIDTLEDWTLAEAMAEVSDRRG